MQWSDLKPSEEFQPAFRHAGPRPEAGEQNEKRRWSEKFAHACAVAIANQFLKSSLKGKTIRPTDLKTGVEKLIPLGAGTSKRIDVTVTDPILGLEIGVSLKGLNFRDTESGYFDKNLTGRLYELADEVRLVHEHLPHAMMVGVIFLPLESTNDKKTENSSSSFANAVTKLRQRTGRLDAAMLGQASRCDMGYVGLYTHGSGSYEDGLLRFFNVEKHPPKKGRPVVAETLTIAEMVDEIVGRATFSENQVWGVAEEDVAGLPPTAGLDSATREEIEEVTPSLNE